MFVPEVTFKLIRTVVFLIERLKIALSINVCQKEMRPNLVLNTKTGSKQLDASRKLLQCGIPDIASKYSTYSPINETGLLLSSKR